MRKESIKSASTRTCAPERENCAKYDEQSSITRKFERFCGFRLDDVSSFDKFTNLLYQPTDAASLGVVRALFGLCMVLDVVEERGLADVDIKWGDPSECRFPLIHGMKPPSLPWIIVIYGIMWMSAFGIMLGWRFKLACSCFVAAYWYIFLLDKTYWNNHTYLYGIVGTLLWGTEANKYFALDANKQKGTTSTVPLWNYFILKFQFFVLYFLAGLKKSGAEWLSGYAMTNLSAHWVFSPFKLILTTEQTDFFIVHWFGCIFDLTVGFWMLFQRTRVPAMIFCTVFHLMNSRLFSIGMFPYVCLATMPLFCNTDWPRKFISYTKSSCVIKSEDSKMETSEREVSGIKTVCKRIKEGNLKSKSVTRRQRFVVSLLLLHIGLQFFLPYSHFITKGYNNWVPGLYGYSWDMMVHVWDTILVVIKVHDNVSNEDRFLDPKAWVQTDRWEKHGDMARQYAFCLRENLIEQKKYMLQNGHQYKRNPKWTSLSSNLSIYIDVWCSLNGRFQQRMFDPNVDLLTVDWHPFRPISFLMPLLSQYSSYRYKIEEIQQHVYTWSNDTDVLFVADFPGMHLDNYIAKNFTNVSLTVLEGEVTYSDENQTEGVILSKESSIPIKTEQFHRVKTTSAYPACYMYTYNNRNKQQSDTNGPLEPETQKEVFSISKELNYKIEAWSRALNHIVNAFFYLVYDVPMVRRVHINK
ncbi:Vitamin K-dependent gamma-carboxylase [Dufourea novaeangliae]|uniref:Vitamin K-dependent gamma-carboxylase n=1 Tax=Dufourea novaeangliae TaxID=178035 RepID=A0A154PKJ1_DUFNO|nr:Vitamin K-dependent gamma-carboxylase [Dufourea novaeangliae]